MGVRELDLRDFSLQLLFRFHVIPHHRGTGSGILDRSAALEAGFGPVVDVTLAGNVVRRHVERTHEFLSVTAQ